MLLLTLTALSIWLGLASFRGGFWKADQVLPAAQAPGTWPEVAVVIPARNEAETIRPVVEAHRVSDYPGALRIVVCDDGSDDGTAEEAQRATGDRPLDVVSVPPLAEGWSGKLWALKAGVDFLKADGDAAPLILFTDADIVAGPSLLKKLVATAERDQLALTSIMAQLDARGFWGGLLIPAFIFFFQKLYPFPLINTPASSVAGAAGGVVLLRREALEGIGGLEALKGALIDDCTLAKKVKRWAPRGRIALYLSSDFGEAISLRDNRGYAANETMVTRTAYAQLGYNPLLLVGTLLGLALTYLAAPLVVLTAPIHGNAGAFWLSLVTWLVMAHLYRPTLRRYGKGMGQSLTLPFAAAVYGWFTWLSGWRHMRGRGNAWKGRSYGARSSA